MVKLVSKEVVKVDKCSFKKKNDIPTKNFVYIYSNGVRVLCEYDCDDDKKYHIQLVWGPRKRVILLPDEIDNALQTDMESPLFLKWIESL